MIRILPALLFFIFICYVIVLADTGGYSLFFDLVRMLPFGDKVGHFMLYGLLSLLFNYAIRLRFIEKYGLFCQIGSIAVFCFALIEEMSQYFFPGRTVDIVDLLADAAGIAFFTLFLMRCVNSRQPYKD